VTPPPLVRPAHNAFIAEDARLMSVYAATKTSYFANADAALPL